MTEDSFDLLIGLGQYVLDLKTESKIIGSQGNWM